MDVSGPVPSDPPARTHRWRFRLLIAVAILAVLGATVVVVRRRVHPETPPPFAVRSINVVAEQYIIVTGLSVDRRQERRVRLRQVVVNDGRTIVVLGDLSPDDIRQLYETIMNNPALDHRILRMWGDNDDRVEVSCGYQIEPMAGGGEAYTFQKRDDRWELISIGSWIS